MGTCVFSMFTLVTIATTVEKVIYQHVTMHAQDNVLYYYTYIAIVIILL